MKSMMMLLAMLSFGSFANAGIIGEEPAVQEATACVPADDQDSNGIEEVIVQLIGLHGTLQTLVEFSDGHSEVIYTRFIGNTFVPGRVASASERVTGFRIQDARKNGASVGAVLLDNRTQVNLVCQAN